MKKRLEDLRKENQANKEAYKSVMKDVAEAECQIKLLNSEIENLTEELNALKCELEKACEEYKQLHSEHCKIKDTMLHQEEKR